MKRIKNKKASHVGVVLSFVIFMTFVLFLYIVTQPSLKFNDKQNALRQLESKITEKVSADITIVSVFVESQPNCVELVNFLSKTEMNNKTITRSDSGILTSGVSGENLQVDTEGITFFKVYGSDEFPEKTGSLGSCQTISEGNGYTLGLVKTTKEIFETKMIEFIQDYNSNYDSLKEGFGLGLNEFSFEFEYNNGTIISLQYKGIIPDSASVYSDEIPTKYISKNAVEESGTLTIKVWG